MKVVWFRGSVSKIENNRQPKITAFVYNMMSYKSISIQGNWDYLSDSLYQ